MEMRRRPWRTTLPALGIAGVLTLAACGGGGGNSGDEDEGDPQRGGTLTLVGKDDVTSMDTAFSYYTLNYQLMRGFTRQLVTTPPTDDKAKAGKLVADMATELPTKENGGISKDGLTYTFTIKKGVKWNTDPARQVSAKDIERGIKRLCNPNKPSGALAYYTTTIKGMQEFCDGFGDVDVEADAIAEYITNNDISGIEQPDKRTVEIQLKKPTPDFLHIMAEYFATPAPKEYLQHVPASGEFDQNVLSNGPYAVSTYDPGNKIVMKRNPAWEAETDDVRKAYVDKIEVQEGIEKQNSFQQVKVGDADMMWSSPPPTAQLPSLYGEDGLELVDIGSLNAYVVFNRLSTNSDSAVQKKAVRKAIGYAVNKKAMIQQYGGPKIAKPTCQIMPETSKAHIDDFTCPAASNPSGNPKKAKQILADAGYPDGLTLKMKFRTNSVHPEVAQTLKNALGRAGITLQLKPIPGNDFYSGFLQVADNARNSEWDLALPGWVPDWYGLNGRTFLQPLFYSEGLSKSDKTWGTNYGFYDKDKFNKLVDEATSANSTKQAVSKFQEAQKNVVNNFGVIPTMFFKNAQYHSDRVHGFDAYPEYLGDITNMWLEQ